MIRYRHLYCVIIGPGYVGYLLPNQYGVQATRSSVPWYAGVALSGSGGWLLACNGSRNTLLATSSCHGRVGLEDQISSL